MMDIEANKAKCGISSSRYVKGWLKEDLIPGVRSGPSLEDFSSRIPQEGLIVIEGKSSQLLMLQVLELIL